MYIWEDVDATLMDILYPISNRQQIEADVSALTLKDAIAIATIAVKYSSDFPPVLRILSTIAINVSACTDLERRIPGFVRTVLSQAMTLAGVWLVEGPVGDPVDTNLVYDGPVDMHFNAARADCGGSAARPTILFQGDRKDGTSFSYQLDVGGNPIAFTGNRVKVTLIKKTADWTRYLCAAGTISINN
ncbi:MULTISPECIES: hypothetical protein [unclassified Mesorhizobium]|uniref:hypothetical protein n=1 Tax=unclassified Mesorhizobium TaxID=325217 RepID=UPI00333D4115